MAILKSLSGEGSLPPLPEGTPTQSADDVAKQFFRTESKLLPGQWDQLTGYFAETPNAQGRHIYISDICKPARRQRLLQARQAIAG
jgi:hypothetical protein